MTTQPSSWATQLKAMGFEKQPDGAMEWPPKGFPFIVVNRIDNNLLDDYYVVESWRRLSPSV